MVVLGDNLRGCFRGQFLLGILRGLVGVVLGGSVRVVLGGIFVGNCKGNFRG